MRRINNLQDVVNWGLCVGCGACKYACNKNAILLENIVTIGIRPKFKNHICSDCNECLSICPGYIIDARQNYYKKHTKKNLLIGDTHEIWEGYAADKEIRYNASSGGVLTALSLYCLEEEKMEFVLHSGMNPFKPYENITVQSRNRDDLLSRTGSRYIPSSPCDSLRLIEQSERQCVFIGKPCDVAALSQLRKQKPKLDEKIGIVLTFFCAGVPNTQGTFDLIKKLDISPDDISALYYRGKGWPGGFSVVNKSGNIVQLLPYLKSWHFLQKYRSFRCKICPDGLGQLGDISCGDAWHRYRKDIEDHGQSLILSRSEKGREIIYRAMDAGYLILKTATPADVIKAQGLIERRQEIFGRQLAMKMLLIPTTRYLGFQLFKSWFKIPIMRKIKSVLGTLSRLTKRKL